MSAKKQELRTPEEVEAAQAFVASVDEVNGTDATGDQLVDLRTEMIDKFLTLLERMGEVQNAAEAKVSDKDTMLLYAAAGSSDFDERAMPVLNGQAVKAKALLQKASDATATGE